MSEEELPKSRRRMSTKERTAMPSLQERISRKAEDLEEKAKQMAAGPERDAAAISTADERAG
jgi:hypothetical protein